MSARHFKRDAESELGTGVAYYEILDDWTSRQIEVYGDTWRWADEANPSGLSDQPIDAMELDETFAISAEEFERTWERALSLFGRAYRMTVDRRITVAPLRVEDFDAWLDRLDARAHTLLVLAHPALPSAHLAISGGDGRYTVESTDDNEQLWFLCSDSAAGHAVNAEQARAAGHAYLASGRLDITQTWEPR